MRFKTAGVFHPAGVIAFELSLDIKIATLEFVIQKRLRHRKKSRIIQFLSHGKDIVIKNTVAYKK